jgi:hypothetical protein
LGTFETHAFCYRAKANHRLAVGATAEKFIFVLVRIILPVR